MNFIEEVLRVDAVSKQYTRGHQALSDISFTLKKGMCIGLVGESGSGKSTLAKCILMVEKLDSGGVWLNGQPLHQMKKKAMQQERKAMQAVFQHPAASLNPKIKIIDSLMEPLDVQKNKRPSFLPAEKKYTREAAAVRLMEMVGLSPSYLRVYPHELSGGQKQRIAIARAISTEPALIILDEPTASLDVLAQADILQLLKSLKFQLGLSYLFISHDLAAVQFLSDYILVMRHGRIEDRFDKKHLFSQDRHSYTKKLIHVFESQEDQQ